MAKKPINICCNKTGSLAYLKIMYCMYYRQFSMNNKIKTIKLIPVVFGPRVRKPDQPVPYLIITHFSIRTNENKLR